MIEKINSAEDVKKLNIEEQKQLAEEIRKYILEIVSKNGGHLASNLGVVELTIALHTIFDLPKDKIVWDVGHQTYVHKILTGRREQLKTLRQLNGIAGFPKTNESETDCFNTGHSSTSISAALGMARARDIKGEKNNVIAVIGDGALTGGMALEALNDAGSSQTRLTVILNDNEMSISKNVGALHNTLDKIRVNSVVQYVQFCRAVIELYTDLEIDENDKGFINGYDALKSSGLLDILMVGSDKDYPLIPMSELNEFKTILTMKQSDTQFNETTAQAFISKQIRRISDLANATLTPLMDVVSKKIDSLPNDELRKILDNYKLSSTANFKEV